jgi:hypothetical protein
LFLVLFQIKVEAQTYRPVLGQSNEWYYNVDHFIKYLYGDPILLGHPMDMEYKYSLRFYTMGDSMLGGVKYKKLFLAGNTVQSKYFGVYGNNDFLACLREDSANRRLYYRSRNSYDSVERVLYDFNLKKNDSFYYFPYPSGSNVEIFGANLGWTKIIETGTIQNTFGVYPYVQIGNLDKWLTGIGSIDGFFYVGMPPNNAQFTFNGYTVEHINSTLTCAFKDSIQIYGNGYCSHPSAVEPDMDISSQIKIFNSDNCLYISNSGKDISSAIISVYDLTGRLLQSTNMPIREKEKQMITLKNQLAPGIYLVSLSGGIVFCARKIEIF